MTYSQNSTAILIYNDANEKFLSSEKGSRRWGQILWNTAEDYITKNCSTQVIEDFMALRNTENDCYFSDLRVENFMKMITLIFERYKI